MNAKAIQARENLQRIRVERADGNLQGANLANAVLDHIYLWGADIWGANLSGADLRGPISVTGSVALTDLLGKRHMILQQHNLYAHVQGTLEERAWLAAYLTMQLRRYVPARGEYRTYETSLYEPLEQRFPAGLLSMVCRAAKQASLDVEILDARTPPSTPTHQGIEWLRDYQRFAYDRVIASSRGIVWIATGGGKTEVAIALGHSVHAPWLFVVHRNQLALQAAERYELRTGEPAGRVGEGVFEPRRFTCASFQTLYARRDTPEVRLLLARARGLVVDEGHTVAAETFQQIAMSTPNAYYRVGLSATPLDRGDRRAMLVIGALGPVVCRVKARTLIEAGVLSEPNIRMVTVQHENSGPVKRRGWAKAYRTRVVENPERNRVVLDCVERAEKPCLIFVKQLRHKRLLQHGAADRGLRVEAVDGKVSTVVRSRRLAALSRGDLDAVISTKVLQEGVDVPELRSIVVATAGRSAIDTLQRVGRGSRVTAGKRTFQVWDMLDAGDTWLASQAKDRMRAYDKEG
jgi:superfamily II DNA or RNA helicase